MMGLLFVTVFLTLERRGVPGFGCGPGAAESEPPTSAYAGTVAELQGCLCRKLG